jgi:hypothetical protein
MAAANSNIQLSSLDFSDIKTNFTNFLQSQDTFKDYNFKGSGLSILLDILAYNTQYNAFYLNMVANEMFLDTAVQRESVVSHAKLLNYTPQSAIAPTATVNIKVNQVSQSSLTLPIYTKFISQAIDGVNYTFVTTNTMANNTVNGTVTFNGVEIKQGQPLSYNFTVNTTANPGLIFEIPDSNIDTSSLIVLVQQSSSNNSYEIFNNATDYLTLNGSSAVYFLQEGISGNYQIYFGDGVLGQTLIDGNIVKVSYISTQGTAAHGANSFTLMSSIGGFANTQVIPVTAASNGKPQESIDSIKFQAPKSFTAQNRAVTKNDYITAIQQNTLGITFDAVNVWGGEENNPPAYGQVFICLKPTGAYDLTETQKQQLLTNVIKPISILTVTPNIINPDYTYIKLAVNAYYNPKQTNLTSAQLQSAILTSVKSFTSSTLNTFNSTFNAYGLLSSIQNTNQSVVTSDYELKLQKKFYPNFSIPSTYTLNYNTPLQRGTFSSGVSSSPELTFVNPTNLANNISGVYLEEFLTETFGIQSINVVNPGFNYQLPPTIKIIGDGTGATANCQIINGSISAINITNSGNNYTAAIVVITPQTSDTAGRLGSAVAILEGQYGTLRSYYYANTTNGQLKTVLNSNVGTIDYTNGIITLNSFNPIAVNNPLGELTISVTPTTSVISSTYDGIITSDPFDANAITVNVLEINN